MTNNDKPRFLEIINGCASAYRQVLEPAGIAIFWNLLEQYDVVEIERAFLAHMKTKTFFPSPAEIITLLDIKNKRISADEAWAIVDKDETETIVWTDEMCQARAIVEDLILSGDKIGARMAFKGSYERLCNEAMVMGRAVRWSVSMGTDKRKSREAIEHAVSLGRISTDRAQKLLPDLQTESVIVGLLFHDNSTKADNEILANWKKLKKSLNAGVDRTEKRIAIIAQKLDANITENERYLLESELSLLLASQANRQEVKAKQLQQQARNEEIERKKQQAMQYAEES